MRRWGVQRPAKPSGSGTVPGESEIANLGLSQNAVSGVSPNRFELGSKLWPSDPRRSSLPTTRGGVFPVGPSSRGRRLGSRIKLSGPVNLSPDGEMRE